MYPKSGQQTDYSAWHCRRYHGDRFVLIGLHLDQPVQPNFNPLDVTLGYKALKLTIINACCLGISRPEEGSHAGSSQGLECSRW